MSSEYTDRNQSVLNKGKQDKFRIVLNVPPILQSINFPDQRQNGLVNLNKLQFSAINVIVPGTTISPTAISFGGQTPQVTSQTRDPYPQVKVSFNVDNNFDNYHLLWMWLEAINHHKESGMDPHFDKLKMSAQKTVSFGAPIGDTASQIKYKHIEHRNSFGDYQTPITVYGLREYNEPIIEFTYTGAFITNLAELNFNFAESGELTCSFSFAFSQLSVKLLPFIPVPTIQL
jgi:hypothetical protein